MGNQQRRQSDPSQKNTGNTNQQSVRTNQGTRGGNQQNPSTNKKPWDRE